VLGPDFTPGVGEVAEDVEGVEAIEDELPPK
jgi:hypothetical protein